MHWYELAASLFGVHLSEAQLAAFDWYASELRAWNQRFNLTSVTDRREIEIKHFLDSLSGLLVLKLEAGEHIVDVGTGAGFPGIPLQIASPQVRTVLVESIGKKARFCQHVVNTLGLATAEVVHARAEQVGRQEGYRAGFDWAVARAVAQLPILMEYLLPLMKLGGTAIAQKGETGPAEAQSAQGALEVLGGRLREVITVELPGVAETRHLVVVEKVAATPEAYPRRPGIPTKRPL